MSCQQAPRISEDPYTFAESPGTLFTSSITKLTPIIKSHQKLSSELPHYRTNGVLPLVNGVKHHPNHQQQNTNISINHHQQQQQRHSPIYSKTPQKITKKLLPPPPLSLASTQIHTQAYLKPLPPLYHQQQQQQIQQKQTLLLKPSASNINHSIIPLTSKQNQPEVSTTQPQLQNEIAGLTGTIIKVETPYDDTSSNEVGGSNVPVLVTPKSEISFENPVISSKNQENTDANTFREPKIEAKSFLSFAKKASGKSQSTRAKRSYSQTSHHEALQRIPTKLNPIINAEWHAPNSYVFDHSGPCSSTSEPLDLTACTQTNWFLEYYSDPTVPLTREQRLEQKRAHLRRKAVQYSNAQLLRNAVSAKRRLIYVVKAIDQIKNKDQVSQSQKCCIANCVNDALTLTAYCYLHITLNSDQKLFHPCTAKFSDNSQCRVPVFDISHELPLCREHAWKRDNYNRMLQEQKPKKLPRKKSKPSAMTRPPKRNKKKKKIPPKQFTPLSISFNQHHYNHPQYQQSQQHIQLHQNSQQFHSIKNIQIPSIASPNNLLLKQQIQMMTTPITQELLNENSSAYESSEDTGVGGLSESELIGAHDVIEEIALGDTRLLEEHDLTNVLNQFPEDAFNELFSVQHSDQEDLERALEAVDEDVQSLEMTGDSSFLGDFLDVDDQILEDSDICTDVLQSPGNSEIRGLVHT